jgi:hypothetical protein
VYDAASCFYAIHNASARKFFISHILVWSVYVFEEAGCMVYSNMYYSFFELDFYISDGRLVV